MSLRWDTNGIRPWNLGIDRFQSSTLVCEDLALVDEDGRRYPILRRLEVAEIFAAYANGDRLFDVSGNRHPCAETSASDVGATCLEEPRVLDGLVLREAHDDQVRRVSEGIAQRGKAVRYWCTLAAANYRYLIEYTFRDDASIQCRVGATGHNAFPRRSDGSDAHLHVGCWRMEFDLGAADSITVEALELRADPNGPLSLTTSPIDQEGGGRWNASAFTRLRVVNRADGDAVQRPIVGYEVVASRWGTVRSAISLDEAFANDYWVTRANPDSPQRIAPEIAYRSVPWCASHREPLRDRAPVLWVHGGFVHVPRGEDFGTVGGDNAAGVAATMWAGVTLTPIWRANALAIA